MASSVILTLWWASYWSRRPFKNLNGLLLGGLAHHDRLEPALQRGVLFDVLAVFVHGGGADDLQFAPGQGGL